MKMPVSNLRHEGVVWLSDGHKAQVLEPPGPSILEQTLREGQFVHRGALALFVDIHTWTSAVS